MIEIDKNEQIIQVVHRHWFVLLGDCFILVFAVLFPIILLFVLHLVPIEKLLVISGSTFAAGGFFLFTWLMIVWMLGWNMWTDYYLDVLIVTDRRIFDIEQGGLFRRKSSSFRIDRIQNITVDMKGVIQTLFDFGTIKIETAGEKEDFIATYVGRPYDIKKMLNEMQDREVAKTQFTRTAST
jgi:uncharacterized membrane protein YdbT with pleckstrin-like domain